MVVNHLRKFTRSVLPTVVQGLVLASASYACFSPPGRPSGQATDANSDAPVEPPASPTGVHRIAAGANNACAIDNEGALWCWGQPNFKVLGPNSQVRPNDSGPFKVPNPQGTKWDSVGLGLKHACGKSGSSVYCWGDSEDHQSPADTYMPTLVPLPSGFATESLSISHNLSCAHGVRAAQQESYCWGRQTNDLPLVEAASDLPAIKIGALSPQLKWTKIVSGVGFVCALSEQHKIYCWGYGAKGQLGSVPEETVTTAEKATLVSGDYIDIAVNAINACGVTTAGALMCWGSEDRLLLSSTTHTPTAITVPSQANEQWASVALGNEFACARKVTGTVFCWGKSEGGVTGTLGGPRTTPETQPFPIHGFGPGAIVAIDLVAGAEFACVRSASGEPAIGCWGQNTTGTLGVPSHTSTPQPARLSLASGHVVEDIAAGVNHTCVLTGPEDSATMTLQCWGHNNIGQAGPPGQEVVFPPATLAMDATALTAREHTYWVVNHTSIRSTKDNDTIPPQANGTQWTQLASNEETCALDTSDRLWCWGRNLSAQSGDHATITERTPPTGIGTWRSIKSGNQTMFAVVSDTPSQRVVGWGSPANSELGGNTARSVATIGMRTDVVAIEAGKQSGHACAVFQNTPYVTCWGANESSQSGAAASPNVPQASVALTAGFKAVEVAAASQFSCARSDAGKIVCWGARSPMGFTNGAVDATPTAIDLQGAVATKLVAGAAHACVVVNDRKEVRCWGSGERGQFGNGAQHQIQPAAVPVPR